MLNILNYLLTRVVKYDIISLIQTDKLT